MGRMERACGEALTRNPLQLQVDLTHVTDVDATAAAILEQLHRRGARLRTVATSTAGTRRTGPRTTRINGTRLGSRG